MTLVQPFNQLSGGVQRSNFKMGKYFFTHGYKVYYFSFSSDGHENPEYGELFHAKTSGKDQNEINRNYFKQVVKEIQPDIIINHMVYRHGITSAVMELKDKLEFLFFGVLRNSLKNFTLDVRHRMKYMLSPKQFALLNNRAGELLMKFRHIRKHKKELEFILASYDKLVLLTPPNVHELAYFVPGFDKNKVTCISNIVPEISMEGAKKEKIVLHVGRLEESQKRSSLLIDFWSHLHDKLDGWKFVIVGSGPSEQYMKDSAKEKSLTNIEFYGHSDPYPWYARSSIFVMSSGFEGFPNVLLEAQGFGTVPVAFDSYPAISWIINNEEDALLCKAFNTSDMAQKVKILANDFDKLSLMREKAKANTKRFTAEKIGARWLELFDEMNHKT